MRYPLVVFALALIASPTFAKDKGPRIEPPRNDQGRFYYSEVVEVEGIDARELYSRARAWTARTYGSAQQVIEFDDQDKRRLIVKGKLSFSWYRGYPTTVDHKLTVEAKDGRYRYVLTDFYSGRPLEDIRAKRYEEFLHRTNEECILLIASLERAMTDSEDDEW